MSRCILLQGTIYGKQIWDRGSVYFGTCSWPRGTECIISLSKWMEENVVVVAQSFFVSVCVWNGGCMKEWCLNLQYV